MTLQRYKCSESADIFLNERRESDQGEKRKPFIFIRQLSEKLASSKTAVGSKEEEEDLLLDYLSDV